MRPREARPAANSATGVLIDLTFAGEKNASPKYATATVELTQTGRNGQSVVTHKDLTNFIFGPDGYEHKALFLDGATCMPLAIDIHAGKTKRRRSSTSSARNRLGWSGVAQGRNSRG